jgi:hypothetical protein
VRQVLGALAAIQDKFEQVGLCAKGLKLTVRQPPWGAAGRLVQFHARCHRSCSEHDEVEEQLLAGALAAAVVLADETDAAAFRASARRAIRQSHRLAMRQLPDEWSQHPWGGLGRWMDQIDAGRPLRSCGCNYLKVAKKPASATTCATKRAWTRRKAGMLKRCKGEVSDRERRRRARNEDLCRSRCRMEKVQFLQL